MGERQEFQPLTREDRITVVLYRSGIVLSAVILAALALMTLTVRTAAERSDVLVADVLVYCLYGATGISVFYIHLYIGKFKVYLQYLYLLAVGGLVLLLVIGKWSPAVALARTPYSLLLLLPLSGCLGFVTAKEAFCFKLFEGYLLAMLMPLYLLMVAAGFLVGRAASLGLVLIAALFVLFTLRKVFMPLAYDIGDKSAYQ